MAASLQSHGINCQIPSGPLAYSILRSFILARVGIGFLGPDAFDIGGGGDGPDNSQCFQLSIPINFQHFQLHFSLVRVLPTR